MPSPRDLDIPPCPTPARPRFATAKAASEASGRIFALRQQVESCSCRGFHLRTLDPLGTSRAKRLSREVAELEAGEFTVLVVAELRSEQVSRDQIAALRDDRNLLRWIDALKALITNLDAQLERWTDDDPESTQWRIRTKELRRRAKTRLKEVQSLDRERVRRLYEQRGSQKALSGDRAEAGERALRRLAALHPKDFTALLLEEYAATDTPVPTPIQRHAQKHGLLPDEEDDL